MKIVKYEKNNNGQYKVHLSNGENIKLYEDVIIDNNLLYKQEISNEQIENIKTVNEKYNYYEKCVKYITVRLRSTEEIKNYLKKYELPNEEINTIIEKLTKNGLINEEIFTNAFIKDKFNFTSWGPYRIEQELKKHNINNAIISKYLNQINEQDIDNKISKQINKLIKTNKNKSNLRNKIYNNLLNSGFSIDSILRNLNKYNL